MKSKWFISSNPIAGVMMYRRSASRTHPPSITAATVNMQEISTRTKKRRRKSSTS